MGQVGTSYLKFFCGEEALFSLPSGKVTLCDTPGQENSLSMPVLSEGCTACSSSEDKGEPWAV